MVSLQGLVCIAKQPQGKGHIGEADYPEVRRLMGGIGVVLLGIVEGNALLLVCAGSGKLS